MARVGANDVREIFDTDLEDKNLDAFITAANLLVTDLLATKYNASLLAEIERWLAAHFAAQMDPVAEQEKMGDANNKYMLGERGKGLENTPYGQQVKFLDYLGVLSELGKPSAILETAFEVEDA